MLRTGMTALRRRRRERGVERLANRADPHELAVTRQAPFGALRRAQGGVSVSKAWIDVRVGHDAAAETHLCGLPHAQRGLGNAPHLTREADFAEHRGGWRSRPRG